MDWPTLSVILTTRDRPSLLPVALACYRQQTYPRKELVVVDDGERFPVDPSTIEALGGRLIRVAPGTPLGVKLNHGVEAARGRLCQKMDDDDWYAPDFLVSMVSALMESSEVCRPSFAFMMPFLFFELARWEIRRSIPTNVPGATLLFFREDWVHRPFRGVRFDEDTWFVLDRLSDGLTAVPVQRLESFLAIRHSGGARDRGHTWIHQANGQTLESYLQERPLYHRRPEDLLPQWAVDIYRKLAATQGENKGWLRNLAFQFSTEPEQLGLTEVDRLAGLFRTPSLDPETLRHAGQALNFLISSPQAEASLKALFALLRENTLALLVHKTLAESLYYAVTWRRPLIEREELAQLATLHHLSSLRGFLLHAILEPCLFGAPATVTSRQLDGASPTCLYALGQPIQFPLHDEVAQRLQDGPRRVLLVHNIDDAQGDQILRTVPLLQALLDFNPQMEVTLVGNRTYLYSHPRLTAIDIRSDGAASALEPPYDVIVDFFESNIRTLNHALEIETLVQALIGEHPPFLLVCASKAYNHFVYDRVEIAGRSVAELLGLNKRRVVNNYDTTVRLIAELGLPVRTGENLPLSEPVLAGLPRPEAERAWKELTSDNRDRRPVALLLPYGGGEPLKGHTSAHGVAAEMRRLIDRGFFVVLTPTSESWGSADCAFAAVSNLSSHEKAYAVVAPSPGSGPERDAHGRTLLYHIRAADLIVAVEGWMIHAAYCLGKPYEILMLAYSQADEWRPYAPTYRQEVTQTPERPHKLARIFWLEQACDPENLTAVRAAVAEPDRDIRAAAARGLGHYSPDEVCADLEAMLEDPAPLVRAEAARALLQSPFRERNGKHGTEVLQAHDLIARRPPGWANVRALGGAARPAVEVAAASDDPVIRREATLMLGSFHHAANGHSNHNGNSSFQRRVSRLFRPRKSAGAKILILTPVKDAAECIPGYCERLRQLTYPHELLSIGLLESDSADHTFRDLERRMPALNRKFRQARLWKQNFGYRLPPGRPRWADDVQVARRTVLAKSRNHLLFRALSDEDWVLWLDVDVIEYPADILQQLLATGKDIVHPHCVKVFGGPSFDRNAWRDQGLLHLEDLRQEGPLVKLDAVGGTMLLVRANLHREGLIFPPFPYGRANPRIRPDTPELETEGLGLMAQDMGYECWGMPHLEIRHSDK